MRLAMLIPVAFLCTSSVLAETSDPTSQLVTIGEIDGESTTRMSIVNIRLDQPPPWQKVQEIQNHGTFLQLVLPGAIVPEPGKFYDGNNPHLPKVGVFQISPADAGIRLFTNVEASRLLPALSTQVLGSRVVITIDHARLKNPSTVASAPLMGPPAPGTEEPGAPTLTAEEVIARTEVRRDIPPPAEALKGKATAPLVTGSGLDLREKLVQVAAFSGIMILLLLASLAVKPLLRRRAFAASAGGANPDAIRTLATLPLAARQKVSLIQVGQERILLGVTPEAVTFLTTLGSTTPPSPVRAQPAPRAGDLPEPGASAEGAFGRLMAQDGPTLDLRATPTLKKIPGNDESSLRARPSTPESPVARAREPREDRAESAPPKPRPRPVNRPTTGGRINFEVSDDGVKNLNSTPRPAPKGEGPGSQKAIDDVTRLIREKLKTLKSL